MTEPTPIAYRADGRLCSPDTFYALACDPARSVVVEACAGAGKTWMLVSRMLRALLDGVAPHEILAITFTRKAAGEMRARLHQWLAEFAAATATERIQALRDRGLDEMQAVFLEPALAGLHGQVLAGGREVQVHTFHVWFLQLMQAAPHEVLDRLGLQPGMALQTEVAELRPELMRRFHAAVAADAAALADFTLLLERHGRSKLAQWFDAVLARRVEVELADEAGRIEASVPPGHVEGASPLERLLFDELLRARLDRAAVALGRGCDKRSAEAADKLRGALLAGDAPAAYALAWDALFTQAGKPRALVTAEAAPPEAAAAAEALQALQRQQQQQLAHEDHLCMLRLSRLLLPAWRELKRQRAVADMNDLERCALTMLSDRVLSGWVQQRLDARIRQVLIDEFQDTSPLQWHALSAWLSSYAGAGGGSSGRRPPAVFVVGDPKQSIYRFRGAEPRVFGAARDFVREGLGGTVLECDHTRRSTPAVIEALNAVFEPAAQAGQFAGYRPHTTAHADGPLPALFRLPEAPRPAKPGEADAGGATQAWRDSLTERRVEPEQHRRRAEAAQVAAAIVALVAAGHAPGRLMVLSRKRESLALVADELRLRDVPCLAAEDLKLADLPEALDLVALLDVLASPGHDLSLAQALKSPLFGVDDAQLLQLAQRARGRPWSSALARWDEAPEPLARARRLLAGWRSLLPVLPPHDLLDRIVDEGDVLARLVAAARPERRVLATLAVQALLAQALALDGGRYATLYNFVRALRLRPVKVEVPGQAEAVQLLTVHGAKGLEAEVVFLLDTDPEPMPGAAAGLCVDWPLHDAAPALVAFVAGPRRVPSLVDWEAREAALAAREELNLLYVGMTRAEQQLVISRTLPHRTMPAPWWERLAPLAMPWAPDLDRRHGSAGAPPQVPELPPAPPAAGAGTATAASRPPALDDAAARLGQAVHRVLEWASHQVPGADAAVLAGRAAREFALPDDQVGTVAQAATAVLSAPHLQCFFDPRQLRWSGNEVPVAVAGDSLRIDRLVQTLDGTWWVLDYKLNAAPEQLADNLAQLDRYRRAVAALQPGEPVRAAFVARGGRLVEPGAAVADFRI